MKKSIRVFVSVSLFLVCLAGCAGKPKPENKTALFKDYEYLENSLTMVMSFPNKPFLALYEKFRRDHGWDGAISGLKDGDYESYSTIDLRGYVHYVRFTVTKGAITSVYYNEFKPGDTFGKRTDEEYGRTVNRNMPDIFAKAYPQMEANLLAAQNPVKVDTVSGATLASYRFQLVLLKALYEASSGHVLNTTQYTEGPALTSN